MKRVIVTGANGFIGCNVVRCLLSEGVEVISVDLDGHNKNIPSDSENIKSIFIPCDLTDPYRLLQIIESDTRIKKNDAINSLEVSSDETFLFDAFYHFAWIGSAGEKRFDTKLQLQNAQNTVDALKVAKKLGCKKFICAGSIMEEESYVAAMTQGNRPGLGYIYGSGKLVAHTMCMSVAASIGIDLCWAMITNAYGVGEVSPRFINTTLRKIINGEPLQFTAGTQNYDFVYIDDIARAFYFIGEKGIAFKRYVIGSGKAQPLKNFILEIKNSVAPDREFIFGDVPFTGVNMPLSSFDISDLEKDTGFKCKVSFSEGIKRTLAFLKEIR
jgi:nucleoside-diphosphate-sugar epimerase